MALFWFISCTFPCLLTLFHQNLNRFPLYSTHLLAITISSPNEAFLTNDTIGVFSCFPPAPLSLPNSWLILPTADFLLAIFLCYSLIHKTETIFPAQFCIVIFLPTLILWSFFHVIIFETLFIDDE